MHATRFATPIANSFSSKKKGVRMTPEKYGIVQLNGFPSYCTVLQKFRDSKERAKLRMWPPYKTPLLTHMYVSFSSTLHLSQVIKQSSKHKLVRVSIRIIKATYNRQTTSSELRYSGLARIYVESWKEDTTREVEIKSQKVYLNSFFLREQREADVAWVRAGPDLLLWGVRRQHSSYSDECVLKT